MAHTQYGIWHRFSSKRHLLYISFSASILLQQMSGNKYATPLIRLQLEEKPLPILPQRLLAVLIDTNYYS